VPLGSLIKSLLQQLELDGNIANALTTGVLKKVSKLSYDIQGDSSFTARAKTPTVPL
jgi:hypothetical protein